jgi:hypothetical protein
MGPVSAAARIRCLAVAVLAIALAAAGPALAKTPKKIKWGSSLKAAATATVPGVFHADAEFWPISLGPDTASGVQRAVKAPKSGKILFVKLKTGDDASSVNLRFSVIHPQGGGHFQVLTSSTPSLPLAAHSPGVHTFNMQKGHGVKFNMPINKGDYLAVSTPGAEPGDMVWYGNVPSASVFSFTSQGATQDPGHVWDGTAHSGRELLMQVTEQPGKSYDFHLP